MRLWHIVRVWRDGSEERVGLPHLTRERAMAELTKLGELSSTSASSPALCLRAVELIDLPEEQVEVKL